ncbi:MAG: hypothetical protein IPO27_12690 [Bacteroidetes bacterium]|nr:hypothetical protein [Bacteroidota bacterium]
MMKKNILLLCLVLSSIVGVSQNMIGLQGSNYAGINAIQQNPAATADSRYLLDIAIGTGGVYFNNDYFYLQKNKTAFFGMRAYTDALTNDGLSEKLDLTKSFNEGTVNFRGMVLSGLWSINPKHSVGIYFQARAAITLSKATPQAVNFANSGFTNESLWNKTQTVRDLDFSAASWLEYGVSYATVFHNKNNNVWKAGANLKYCGAIAGGYVKDVDLDILIKNDSLADITVRNIEYARVDVENSSRENFAGTGFGFDLGVQYEWREDASVYSTDPKGQAMRERSVNKYKLRAGLSIIDIGGLSFNENTQVNRVENRSGTNYYWKGVTYSNIEDFDTSFSNFFYGDSLKTRVADNFKMSLPTAINIQVDYHIKKDFYAGFQFQKDINFGDKSRPTSLEYLSIIPRWERRWFEVSLPISFME